MEEGAPAPAQQGTVVQARELTRRYGEGATSVDALLLAAGELGRAMRPPLGEAGAVEQLLEEPLLRLLPGDRER